MIAKNRRVVCPGSWIADIVQGSKSENMVIWNCPDCKKNVYLTGSQRHRKDQIKKHITKDKNKKENNL